MNIALIPFAGELAQKQAANEIIKCNEISGRFGLVLTQSQAAELAESRTLALQENGRIEFGGGVIHKLIHAFCDSPYLSAHNYVEALHALTEIFYYYKNETMDLVSDDDLIRFMEAAFNGSCQGSLDLLADRALYHFARNLRFGQPAETNEADTEYEEEEDAELP